ncbi:hypothetical protein EDC01DRAFT_720349 [Geopyxis carbonaria]|nr:hypothetical protein EDC01DRAFT_720349 [Geopyxis carbonaria]
MEYLSELAPPHRAAPPLSVAQICEKALEFDYNHLIPLRYWFRTADTVFKEAYIYLKEGNQERAYLLFFRYVDLVLNKLREHPEVHANDQQLNLKRARARAFDALKELERLKPPIAARHESHLQTQQRAKQSAHRRSVSTDQSSSYSQSSSSSGRPRRQPKPLDLSRRMSSSSLSGGPFSPPLDKSMAPLSPKRNGNSLALDMARQEFEKRERIKRDRRMAAALELGRNIPMDSTGAEIRRISTPQPRFYPVPQNGGYYPLETDDERIARETAEEEADLNRSLQALKVVTEMPPPARRRSPYARKNISDFDMSAFPDTIRERDKSPQEKHVGSWQGSYPTVPKRQHSPARLGVTPQYPPSSSSTRAATPTLPPKVPAFDGPPPLPSKTSLEPPHSPYDYYSQPSSPACPPKPPKEPETLDVEVKEFRTAAALENGSPLRTIFLPARLRETFLGIAANNTRLNFETCGILCGTLVQNAFFISRLVIPEQEATSDTCAMKDEEGLFQYCDTEDLMVLGWIHTHPTQTCFMSSVDLHTHSGYQWQLKESIAIVCAPRHEPSWGVFRLTDPPGVRVISECTQRGLFHPHGESNVYTDAMRPGHVSEVPDMGFDCVDLRKNGRR